MVVNTIGFTKKYADEFFGLLKDAGVEILIDTRISPASQLAGFAKQGDLIFFLDTITGIKYDYRLDFAPTRELLDAWRAKRISWADYEREYNAMLEKRGTYKNFLHDYGAFERVCLLCSEATPEYCHRRLLAEKLATEFPGEVEVKHL